MLLHKNFYKTNDLFKFHRRNVLYVAYVGQYDTHHYYKYGISSNIFQREYEQHRKNFEEFQMCLVKKTHNMHQAEELLEKELKIRKMHTHKSILGKRQTELFVLNDDYDYKYVERLINRIVRHVDKEIIDEIKGLKKELKLKENEIRRLRAEK